MNQDNEDKLTGHIKQTLDDSVESLDGNTLYMIRQIRAHAIDKAIGKAVPQKNNWTVIMTGALATACVMIFAVMILLKSPASNQLIPLDDLDLISSSESLELYEDLEFYEWLEDDVLQS
ncbi:MAG: hypothetical protein DHS20C13_30390 [Thermodesulfobacteriota bacterium]|nr:MAG: hypothetical protein DHS20C13_30390 [Thermodesulfobacteriota bacterium]